MIEIENLTFKQCINIIAVMNLLLKENVINFNPDEAVATLNYDEAMRYLENQNVEQNKEIERLNNIINELEKYLENVKTNLRYIGVKWDNDCLIRAEVIQQVLHKLKELKESDNND